MDSTKTPVLSKSRFLAGEQCHLRLWYSCFNRDLATPVSPAQQAILDTGQKVGQLATRLYPEGVLIEEDHLHHEEAVRSTHKTIMETNAKAIFEAAFLYDDVRVRVDILERLDNGQWNLIEVKSSTSVKDVHLPDVAIQYYVLKGAGLKVNRAYLVHINNQYEYDGLNLRLEDYFSHSDVTDQVYPLQNDISLRLAEMKGVLAQPDSPVIRLSSHCKNPYKCEFWEYCTEEMPEHWVMELYRITQKKLDDLDLIGVTAIQDIPNSFQLSALQERIRNCVTNNEEFVSADLGPELEGVEYPLHFLDFETASPAIPLFSKTRPYQTIPFQWSNHILSKNGDVEHHEHISAENKDPREDFTKTLFDSLGEKGTIFIFGAYEKRIIKELADFLPKYRDELLTLQSRLKDLNAVIRKCYYHPHFHGSFSLKSVLPALVPEMSYENLAIQEGGQASHEYLRLINPKTPDEEKQKIKENLLIYCGHDTLAMLKIRDELIKRLHS